MRSIYIYIYKYLSCRSNCTGLPFKKSDFESIVVHAGFPKHVPMVEGYLGEWKLTILPFGVKSMVKIWFRQDCKPWPGNTKLTIPFGPDQKLRLDNWGMGRMEGCGMM